VKALINKNIDCEAETLDFKMRPLHLAVLSGNQQVVKELIQYKVERNPVDDLGATPLMYACRDGKAEIVKLLI
jgi:ankyrin repeat protein